MHTPVTTKKVYSQASFTPISTENLFCDRSVDIIHSLFTERNVVINRMDNNAAEFFKSILSSLQRFSLTYMDSK